jgi:hypothetical protein
MIAVQSGVPQLKQGEYLAVNQTMRSPNGQYNAILQPDGNLVVRYKEVPLWSTNNPPNTAITKLFLQYDGNLVMLGAGDSPERFSETSSKTGDTVLKLNNDGTLNLPGDGKSWATDNKVHTVCKSLHREVANPIIASRAQGQGLGAKARRIPTPGPVT